MRRDRMTGAGRHGSIVCEHRKAIHELTLSYEIDGKKRGCACISRSHAPLTEGLHFRHISRTMPRNWLARKRRLSTDAGKERTQGGHRRAPVPPSRSIEGGSPVDLPESVYTNAPPVNAAAFRRFIENSVYVSSSDLLCCSFLCTCKAASDLIPVKFLSSR